MSDPSGDIGAGRERRSDGERTHARILEAAARIASVEGLEGLTIGRLAEASGVSKSGVHAHFGSKERLQVETIQAAQAIFQREVLASIADAPPGLTRLGALCDAYLSYVERRVFPGGCFFASLLAEMDARSGAGHDMAVEGERRWLQLMADLADEARRTGEIAADADTDQLAFELQACLELGNYHFILFGDTHVLERSRAGVAGAIDRRRVHPP